MAVSLTPPDAATIADAIRRLVAGRGAGKSICPSEVARALSPDGWRPLLGAVRDAASGLARDGEIEILRKGRAVDPASLRGVVRLRIAPR